MGRKRKPAGGAVSQQSENSMAGGVQNPDRGSARSTGLFVLGAAFSALAAAMSGLLVIKHLWGMALPGCGPGGSCDQAAKSLFGALRIPSLGLEWPVAHLGLAYFLAAFGAWLVARGRFPRPLVYLVRLGALISLGFCAIIAVEKLACGYCLAAHVGNFAFWIV
ncbi:MAG: vitamin K epoxide reductase family protein, partial [Planctomycetota bacterium]